MQGLKPYLRGLVLIAGFVALGYLVKTSGLDEVVNEAWIDREIRGRGLTGEIIFLAVGAGLTAIGFPRQAVSFLGGYAFGMGEGTALALLASSLGCIVAFSCARLLGREAVRRRFGERIRRLDSFLHDNPFSMALLMRLLPVGSNFLINLAAGVSGVRGVHFVAGSTLGYLPQTVVFALLGSGIHLDPGLRIGASIALFILSGMLGVYLFRRFRARRPADLDVALAGGKEGTP